MDAPHSATLPTSATSGVAGPSGAAPSHPGCSGMTLHVHPTTGGNFAVDVNAESTVESLKGKIARQLRLPKERLSLLFRETHLRRGTLSENGVVNGCKLTLLPVVESGIMSQRQDQTLIQALQNLTEAQVDNFLNGKQPLTLALRLGNHMVFVQLQLAGNPSGAHHHHQQQQQHRQTTRRHRVNTSTQTACHGTNGQRLHGIRRSRSASATAPVSATTSPQHMTPPCIVPPMPSHPTGCPRSQCPVHGKPACVSAEEPHPHLQQQPPHHYYRHPHHAHHQLHRQMPLTPPASPPASPTSPSPPSSPTSPNARPHHQCPPRSSGAYIESVEQHSPGIFSGTFSGILGAAVQDQQGRPRRDISTIAHIMNDLLQAAPFYKQHLGSLCCSQHRGRHREAAACGKTNQHRAAAAQQLGRSMASKYHHELPKEYRQQQYVENDHTRSKMAHLQTLMRERQARRAARRDMHGPYMPQHLRRGNAQAAAVSIPEKTNLDCGNKERAMTDNCYPSLKQDYLAV